MYWQETPEEWVYGVRRIRYGLSKFKYEFRLAVRDARTKIRKPRLKVQNACVLSWRGLKWVCWWKARLRCQLLELPAELRMKIWEYVLAGHYIAFHDDQGRLAYGLMSETHMRTPGKLLPCASHDLVEDVHYITGKTFDENEIHQDYSLVPHKEKHLTSLLKTCRTIYSEAISLFYTSNTFVFLQNPALEAFYNAIARHHFHQIRSIHIHWHIRVNGWRRPLFLSPWNKERVRIATAALVASMQNLQHLSVFLQGPLSSDGYKQLLEGMSSGVAQPKFFAVRLGWGIYWPGNVSFHDGWAKDLGMEEREYGAMRVYRPILEQGSRNWKRRVDEDGFLGMDTSWRLGALFEPDGHGGGDGVVISSYIVRIPLPRERHGRFSRTPRGWGED